MVERDKVEYRDPTPFDESKLQSLQVIIDALLHKQDARDVRAPMAQLPDALIKALQDGTDLGQTGALAELVAARGQFETLPIHEAAQDNEIQTNTASIQVVQNKASYAIEYAKAAASGSPRGSFATIGDLRTQYPNGTDGIFVTTDTGHWWSYVNGSWQDGGVWQATKIADNSVSTQNLTTEVKANALDTSGGAVVLYWGTGYVASSSKGDVPEGTIVANSDYSITQPILVHAGDLISVYGYVGTMTSLVSLWGVDGSFIKSLKDGISANELAVVTVPQTGYIRVSNYNAGLSTDAVTVEHYPVMSPLSMSSRETGAISWSNLLVRWLPRTFVGSAKNSNYPNRIAHSLNIQEKYNTSSVFFVNAGTIVTIKGGISSNAYLLSEFQSNGEQVVAGLITGTNTADEFTYYIDHNAYLRVSNNTSVQPYPNISTQRTTSALAGKTINVLGDSFVKNNNDSVEDTWHYKLAHKYAMTYNNYGVNGNGLLTPDGSGAPVVDRFGDMADGADYIVVIGGKNDYNYQYPMADFKAGLVTLIKGLVVEYPAAKLCFFTPWSLGDSEKKDIKLADYAQAIEDTCNMFGVACFNSYKKSNITPWDTNFRKKYMQSDDDISHLNSAGHDRFLPRAEAFLNSL